MKAIAYYASLPITDPNALQDIELPEPVAGPRDLLVEVKAISVNPVDTKVRQNVARKTAPPRCWAGTWPAWSRPSAAK
jgi:NADPH:quinone reductase-like Zn-dependent oxidoreductase